MMVFGYFTCSIRQMHNLTIVHIFSLLLVFRLDRSISLAFASFYILSFAFNEFSVNYIFSFDIFIVGSIYTLYR